MIHKIKKILDGSSVSRETILFLKDRYFYYARLTARFRLLPDFIIVGGQRCGTSSLYRTLIQHPQVLPALTKEVHYFDHNYEQGIDWYKANFPFALYKSIKEFSGDKKVITGEASPFYLFHPLIPERIIHDIGKVKIIVLLRNPVERAYSQFHHETKLGWEKLTFAEAIRSEKSRLAEVDDEEINEKYLSYNYRHYSYMERGKYADQLERWFTVFGQDNILIIKSEDLFLQPQEVYQQVYKFLDILPANFGKYRKYNSQEYPDMDSELQDELIQYFKPYNYRLEELTGRKFEWN